MALEIKTNDQENFNKDGGIEQNGIEQNGIEALELEHLIGMTSNYRNCLLIHPINKNKCIYSIGPTVIIKDIKNGINNNNEQISLRNHDESISCLAISECGTMIASGQKGSNLLKGAAFVNLYIYDNKNNLCQYIHQFSGLLNGIYKIFFTKDSKFLIAIDLNGLFIIWDCKTFETIFAKQINNNNKENNQQIINIDSCHILNVENDPNFGINGKHNIYKILISYQYNLYLWTIQYSVKYMEYVLSSKNKFSFPPNRTANRLLTNLSSIKIDDSSNSNNNFLIAATTNIGEVYLFSSTSKSNNNVFLNSFQACSRGANIVLFINKNNMIIGGGDGTIKYFQENIKMDSWQMINKIQLKSSINTLQKISSNIIYATSIESNVYEIDINNNGKYNLLFQSPFNPIHKIVFGEFNHIFATLTSLNGILTIWDLSNYLSLGEIIYENGGSNGTALMFYKDNKILTGYDNGAIMCSSFNKNNNNNKLLFEWEIKCGHRGKVNCISIICDKKLNILLLLSGGDDGLLNIWNYSTQQLIQQYHIMIENIKIIINDCKYKELIHLLGSNGQIVTFSLKREGIIIRRMIKQENLKKNGKYYNFGKLTDLIQNKNGEFELISSTSNGYLLIWDQELTQLIQFIDCNQIINQNINILSISLSNNSKYLCFGDNVGSIYIISIKTRKLITKYEIHSAGITSIAWTPDDKQIITSSNDSSIAVSNFYT